MFVFNDKNLSSFFFGLSSPIGNVAMSFKLHIIFRGISSTFAKFKRSCQVVYFVVEKRATKVEVNTKLTAATKSHDVYMNNCTEQIESA